MSLRSLLVGPRDTALRVGLPAVVAAGVLTAATTTLILRSNSGGGVYFPIDAVFVAVVGSAIYAGRYRAAAVCVAIGVAAFAGSSVGFHAALGDDAVLRVLARFVRDAEPAALGAGFGAVGAAVGGVVGRAAREVAARR